MTVIAMSHGELSRYDTLLRVERRELRVADAAVLLGLTRRQINRLLNMVENIEKLGRPMPLVAFADHSRSKRLAQTQ
jgi:hypothetical protein